MATSPALADRSTAAPAAPAAAGTGRLAALDAWRGLTVLLMLLVNNVALGSLTPRQLMHAPWGGGLTLTDLVFPWFLFCAALEADLTRVLGRVRPDVVLVPAPQDFHSDHRTLSYIAMRLLGARGQAGRLRYWVVHGGLE